MLCYYHYTCARYGLFVVVVVNGDQRSASLFRARTVLENTFYWLFGKESTTNEEADIMIGEQEFFSYTKKFKYLGSIFASSLKDDKDIKRRISPACGTFAQAEKVLCDHRLQAKTRT